MSLNRMSTAFRLTARGLLRRRIVLFLLLLIPSVFFSVILIISTEEPLWFQLTAFEEEDHIRVIQRHEALVFIALAAVGVLTSFLAMNLAQKDAEVHQRLIVCGYRPWEIVVARLGVLVCVIAFVSAYVGAALPLFFDAYHPVTMLLGLALCGWVYGCYGLLVGALFRQELEGVFFVVLLANLDIGWLQNPIYHAHAQHQVVIRSLPGYLPSQVAMAAAFSEHTLDIILPPAFGGLLYGLTLGLAAMLAYAWRSRTAT